MKSLLPIRLFAAAPADAEAFPGTAGVVAVPEPVEPEPGGSVLKTVRTIAWMSAGLGAVAIGLVVGRELRHRYKFKRRTPYDFYAHSGDEQDMEFGVGI